jgi:putative ABC transport system permease protein
MSWRKGNVRLAVAQLKSSKVRSLLTMLGIVIGVMAVCSVVCIGQGIKQQISSQIEHFGDDILTIRPGTPSAGLSPTSLLAGNGLPSAASSLLTAEDLKTVTGTPGVKFAVPLGIATGSATGDRTVRSPLIIATGADLPTAINQPVAQGGFFDITANNHTVVLGQTMARQLFDDDMPLGQTLTYRGQQFIVTGIFGEFNSAPFSLSANFNDAIFMPYTSAQTLSGGQLALYQILVKAAPGVAPAELAQRLDTRLAHIHGDAEVASVLTAEQSSQGSGQIIHLLTVLVVGVALIAMLVGGVGIMDVLLVSVTERMHEIGLRKAVGATNRQILRQFMAEALVLSSTGAFIGVVFSMALVGLLRAYTNLEPVLVWQVFVLGFVVAVVIGLIFGTAPALKAARKDPIEALRHE